MLHSLFQYNKQKILIDSYIMKKEMAKLTTGDFADFFLTNPTSKTQTSRGRALSAYSRPNTSKFSTIRSVTRGIRNLNIT